MKRRTLIAYLGALTFFAAAQAVAENSTSVDGYTVHHNAFTTDTLTPQVAKAYQIQRSSNRGLLNVSVIKEAPGTTGTSIPARVSAKILTLTGQQIPLSMREIRDTGALYYIGEFPVHEGQTLNFAIQVIPQGRKEPIRIRMDQQFFSTAE